MPETESRPLRMHSFKPVQSEVLSSFYSPLPEQTVYSKHSLSKSTCAKHNSIVHFIHLGKPRLTILGEQQTAGFRLYKISLLISAVEANQIPASLVTIVTEPALRA
jgi:hypothetical protein